MSSSSDSSGPSLEAEGRSPAQLARRILRKLQAAPLNQTMAVADHQKAAEAMARLRDALLADSSAGREVATCLTCAGIAVHRRALIGPEQLDAAESLRTTLALLFVLVVLATGGNEAAPTGHDAPRNPSGASDHAIHLATWKASSLWEALRAADSDADTSSWARVLREPGGLCQSVLQLVRAHQTSPTLAELTLYGATFFRASAAAMAVGLLDSAAPVIDGNDFLTLDAMQLVREVDGPLREERLAGIADCAESEAGQTVRTPCFEPPPFPPCAHLSIGKEPPVFLCRCSATSS